MQGVIQELCKHCNKPLVFPLSNPTSQCEISAENAYKWSDGKCVFAAGAWLLLMPLHVTLTCSIRFSALNTALAIRNPLAQVQASALEAPRLHARPNAPPARC